ncbi:YitT family protein [Heyndrickxia vini]|uniref:YitT family protein n=1 Tax=Heyndrickxia vini TaxID=1476025 RepID=A0ABX7E777_9BACI|nr:YitT family protein [Heyndrickxia vini]QQZ11297.1 YitT family protein [Heyndrickxia vini]
MKRIIIITVACIFIAIGINVFILPLHLINGGIFGVSLLLKYLWGFKLGHLIILLNTPIYLLALTFDKSYFINGLIGMCISSIMIDLFFPLAGIIQLPILLSAILGGLCIGIGVGIMLRHHTSPGGVDLLALLISKWSSINPGIIIFIIDALIIFIGMYVLKDGKLIFSFITISCVGLVVSILNSFKKVEFYV